VAFERMRRTGVTPKEMIDSVCEQPLDLHTVLSSSTTTPPISSWECLSRKSRASRTSVLCRRTSSTAPE
jgi:hypothetical protein